MTSHLQHDLPRCRNCGGPTGRWGWYESEDDLVVYVICCDCLARGTEPAVQIAKISGDNSDDRI
jgi:hypothetical protein